MSRPMSRSEPRRVNSAASQVFNFTKKIYKKIEFTIIFSSVFQATFTVEPEARKPLTQPVALSQCKLL